MEIEELPREECLRLLQQESYVGRVGFIVEGRPMVLPVNSSQVLLKKVHSLSTPAIQIRTGAASATIRNRASLSRRRFSLNLRVNAFAKTSPTFRCLWSTSNGIAHFFPTVPKLKEPRGAPSAESGTS